MKTKAFILLIVLLTVYNHCKADRPWLISNGKQIIGHDTLFFKFQDENFYWGIPNKIILRVNSGKISEVKVSNGIVKKYDKDLYEILPEKYGELILTVNSNVRFQFKKWVYPIPDPAIRIKGSSGKAITIDDIVNNGEVEAFDDRFNFKVKGFDVQTVVDGFCHIVSSSSNRFTKEQIDNINGKRDKMVFYLLNTIIQGPDSIIRIITGVNYYRLFEDKIDALIENGQIRGLPLQSNLRIKITGNPTKEDIQNVKTIVSELDNDLESIDVKLVDNFPSFIINFDDSINYNEFEHYDRYNAKIEKNPLIFFPNHDKTILNLSLRWTSQKNRYLVLWHEITNQLVKLKGRESQNSIFGDIRDEPGLTEGDREILKLIFSYKGQERIKKQLKTNNRGFFTEALLFVLLSLLLFLIAIEVDTYFRISKKIKISILRYLFSFLAASQIAVFSICLISGIDNFDLQKFILPFAIICGLLFFVIDNLVKKLKKAWILLLFEPITSVLILFIGYELVYIFTRGELLKLQFINQPALLILFSIVTVRFLIRYQKIKIGQVIFERDVKIAQQNELVLRAQLDAMQARINPHFLYNALNSIAELSRIDASRTEEMALALSSLFRYNVNREGNVFSNISEEIEMVKLYLFVEKQRFNEKLNYLIEVDENILEVEIPKFLLQPLVENAVKHGISKINNNGFIKIEIKKAESDIEIKIFDNGPEFPDGIINGYGLQNTYEKLDMLCKKPYEIRFINVPKHLYLILKDN